MNWIVRERVASYFIYIYYIYALRTVLYIVGVSVRHLEIRFVVFSRSCRKLHFSASCATILSLLFSQEIAHSRCFDRSKCYSLSVLTFLLSPFSSRAIPFCQRTLPSFFFFFCQVTLIILYLSICHFVRTNHRKLLKVFVLWNYSLFFYSIFKIFANFFLNF